MQHTFTIDNTVFERPEIEASGFKIKSIPNDYSVSWSNDTDPIQKINELFLLNQKNILIIDKKVLDLYKKNLQVSQSQIFPINADEHFKTMESVLNIIHFLYDKGFSKSETLLVVGGGITQDISGFVAGIFKRGMKWILFPTTLLSMCDSCIGGKTGVNYKKAKNQIGLFYPPSEVIINPHFLMTLPQKDIFSGLGEILKLCILGGKDLIELYYAHVSNGLVKELSSYQVLILSALSIKKTIIEFDEFEKNHRKCLNYGHTIGHVIEVLSDYKIPHGSAVVAGMMMINEFSYKKKYLSFNDKNIFNSLCAQLLTPDIIALLKNMSFENLLNFFSADKKVENNEIVFVLPIKSGEMRFIKFALDANLILEISNLLEIFQNE